MSLSDDLDERRRQALVAYTARRRRQRAFRAVLAARRRAGLAIRQQARDRDDKPTTDDGK